MFLEIKRSTIEHRRWTAEVHTQVPVALLIVVATATIAPKSAFKPHGVSFVCVRCMLRVCHQLVEVSKALRARYPSGRFPYRPQAGLNSRLVHNGWRWILAILSYACLSFSFKVAKACSDWRKTLFSYFISWGGSAKVSLIFWWLGCSWHPLSQVRSLLARRHPNPVARRLPPAYPQQQYLSN